MTLEITRTRTVLVRLTTGFLATSAAMGLALIGAPAAQAAQSTIQVEMKDSRIMRIVGTSAADSVSASGGSSNGSGTQILVNATIGQLKAGPGCVQLGAAVRCDGVSRITFVGGSGDDAFRNESGLAGQFEGGPGSDRLSGGPGNDTIVGGPGADFAFGGPGIDSCLQTETESGCEL